MSFENLGQRIDGFATTCVLGDVEASWHQLYFEVTFDFLFGTLSLPFSDLRLLLLFILSRRSD